MKRKKPSRKIVNLATAVSAICDGQDNDVVVSALLSLVCKVIAEKSPTLPDGMTGAAICGLQMMDTVRETWTAPEMPEKPA